MPYIKVKVCQDLYQELGLCPNMELVRSDSKGSLKFVPLPKKSIFDDDEFPLLESLMFGNRMQESGNSNSSVLIRKVSHEDVMRSTSDEPCEDASHNSPTEGGNNTTSENIVSDLNQPVSSEDKVSISEGNVSNPGSSVNFSDEEIAASDKGDTVQKDNPTACLSPIAIPAGSNSHFERVTTASKLSSSVLNIEVDKVCYIELDSRGHLSSVSVTAPPPELSNSTSAQQRFSCVDVPSSALSSDTPIKCEGCSKKYSGDVSFSRHLKSCDKRIKYPRKCENCFSVYKHCSSFIRHKKSCEEVRQRRLKGAALKSACGSETLQTEPKQKKVNTAYPRTCDRCGLIFGESRAFRYHLNKCETYRQTIPSNSKRIIRLPGAVSSNIDLGINSEAKYIPLKEDSESCRFFIRKKAPTDSD